jgi:succinate dehydrogenase/fumarate reductase flavoprotein subunit
MDQYTKDHGAEWYYEHSAVVLTQDENGAVTGAIVKNAEGKYIKFAAAAGTLVATGDFSGSEEMCWALLNDLREMAERAGTTTLKGMGRPGYGHKMCCWAGGLIESLPRPVMGGGGSSATGPWGFSPMLQLNANGKRYANEADTPWIGQIAVRQPKGLLTVITDSKYMDSIAIAGLDHGGPNFGRGSAWLDDFLGDMSHVADAGADGYGVRGITVAERNAKTVYGAQTLEELAGYLGYEDDQVQTFVDEVKRYNEMCAAKTDTDFGKDPKALIPIDTAPFYGCTAENSGTVGIGLVTLAGMVTDDNMNVLDADGEPIEGLYVAGNTLGGRYGLNYVTPYAGNSVGMALTHGWMAGKILTSE